MTKQPSNPGDMERRRIKSPAFGYIVEVYDLRRCLKAIRRSTGWSVRDAAKKARITSSTFSRAENKQPIGAIPWQRLSAFIRKHWPTGSEETTL